MKARPSHNANVPPPLKVLAVEDDENDALLLKTAFDDAGLKVSMHFVGDGKEAIDYLKRAMPLNARAKHPVPNVLLMDLKMPRIGGLEVLEWLRDQPSLRALFVAVLSGSCCKTDFERAYAAGANICVEKPLGYRDLVGVARFLHARSLSHLLSTGAQALARVIPLESKTERKLGAASAEAAD
jgi:CheY-like chemotaxis protein